MIDIRKFFILIYLKNYTQIGIIIFIKISFEFICNFAYYTFNKKIRRRNPYYHEFQKYELNLCGKCLTEKNQSRLLKADDYY